MRGAAGNCSGGLGSAARPDACGSESESKGPLARPLPEALGRAYVWRVLRCDLAAGADFVARLSVFVGGLPYKGADEEMLRALFAPFGVVDNVSLSMYVCIYLYLYLCIYICR